MRTLYWPPYVVKELIGLPPTVIKCRMGKPLKCCKRPVECSIVITNSAEATILKEKTDS